MFAPPEYPLEYIPLVKEPLAAGLDAATIRSPKSVALPAVFI